MSFTQLNKFQTISLQDTAVDHEHERQEQAEDEEASHIGHVAGGTVVPLHRAGGAWALGAVAAPAKERRQSPRQGVQPTAGYGQPGLPVVGNICRSVAEHG